MESYFQHHFAQTSAIHWQWRADNMEEEKDNEEVEKE